MGVGIYGKGLKVKDIDQSGATDLQIMRWSATEGKFVMVDFDVPADDWIQTVSIGDLYDVDITGITNNQVLKWNAATEQFEPQADLAGLPAGSDREIQYNNSGVFGADASFFIGADNAINVEYLKLNTAYTSTGSEDIGSIYWNSEEMTVDVRLTDNVTGQLFHEGFFQSKNQTGATISNGTPVMFAGTTGNSGNIKIQKAIADGTFLPEYTVGITTEDIANGVDGKTTWRGKVRGIDTTGTPYGEVWADGQLIYISPFTAGHLTNVEPQAPHRRILVASVINAHTNGTLLVRPTWSPKFTELDDVNGTALTADGQIAIWDNTNSYFDFTENIHDYALLTDVHWSRDAINGYMHPKTLTDKVGVKIAVPVVDFHVQGVGSFGDSVTKARSGRALNLIDTRGTIAIWGTATGSNDDVAVELISGIGTTSGDVSNLRWDIYLDRSENAFVWRDRNNPGGSVERMRIDTNGQVGFGSSTSIGAQLELNVGSASRVGQKILLAASQTADSLAIQNSSASNLTRFNSSGLLRIGELPLSTSEDYEFTVSGTFGGIALERTTNAPFIRMTNRGTDLGIQLRGNSSELAITNENSTFQFAAISSSQATFTQSGGNIMSYTSGLKLTRAGGRAYTWWTYAGGFNGGLIRAGSTDGLDFEDAFAKRWMTMRTSGTQIEVSAVADIILQTYKSNASQSVDNWQGQDSSGTKQAWFDKDWNLFAPSVSLTGFTQGSVVFSGASGLLSEDNANFFWDDTNNRVGLGINAGMIAKLHILSDNTNERGLVVGVDAAQIVNAIEVQNSSGAGIASISKIGALGIGTNDTANQDGIGFGEAEGVILRMLSPTTNGVGIKMLPDTTGIGRWSLFGAGATFSQVARRGNFEFYDIETQTPRFIIDSSGRFGIGGGYSQPFTAQFELETASASRVAQIIKLAPAQTANAIDVRNSSDVVVNSINELGYVSINQASDTVPLNIKGNGFLGNTNTIRISHLSDAFEVFKMNDIGRFAAGFNGTANLDFASDIAGSNNFKFNLAPGTSYFGLNPSSSSQPWMELSNGTIYGYPGHCNNNQGYVISAVSNHNLAFRSYGNLNAISVQQYGKTIFEHNVSPGAVFSVAGAQVDIRTYDASTIGQKIVLSAAQTANAFEVQNSSGTVLSGHNSYGGQFGKQAVNIQSGNYTLLVDDSVVVFTADATATLPVATGSGQTYRIVCRAGQTTIDGNGTDTIKAESIQYLNPGEDLIITDTASGLWE